MIRFLTETLSLSHPELSGIERRHPGMFSANEERLRKAGENFELFREYGFTWDHIRRLTVREPRILCYRTNEMLRPKLEAISTIGVSGEVLGHAVSRDPRALHGADLHRSVEFFRGVFQGNRNLSRAFIRCPDLFTFNVDTVQKQLAFMAQSGLTQDIIFHAICASPSLLICSLDSILLRMKFLMGLGLVQNSKTFATALGKSATHNIDAIKEKFKKFEALGLLEDEVQDMVRKQPSIMWCSFDKFKAIGHFLIQNGVLPEELVKYPHVFELSLEKRIRPRCNVYKFLVARSEFKRVPCILGFIVKSERIFLDKYVNSHLHKEMLLQLLGRDDAGPSQILLLNCDICSPIMGRVSHVDEEIFCGFAMLLALRLSILLLTFVAHVVMNGSQLIRFLVELGVAWKKGVVLVHKRNIVQGAFAFCLMFLRRLGASFC